MHAFKIVLRSLIKRAGLISGACAYAIVLFLLGLTALRSDEVIDLMIKEYPAKHAEYSVILQERERQRITKEYSVSTLSAVSNISFINRQISV